MSLTGTQELESLKTFQRWTVFPRPQLSKCSHHPQLSSARWSQQTIEAAATKSDVADVCLSTTLRCGHTSYISDCTVVTFVCFRRTETRRRETSLSSPHRCARSVMKFQAADEMHCFLIMIYCNKARFHTSSTCLMGPCACASPAAVILPNFLYLTSRSIDIDLCNATDPGFFPLDPVLPPPCCQFVRNAAARCF